MKTENTTETHTPGKAATDDRYAVRIGNLEYRPHWKGTADDFEMRCNASRLALCWNTHAELVAALKMCIGILQQDQTNCTEDQYNQARAALAQATGDAP